MCKTILFLFPFLIFGYSAIDVDGKLLAVHLQNENFANTLNPLGATLVIPWEADISLAGAKVRIEIFEPGSGPLFSIETEKSNQEIFIPETTPSGNYKIRITSLLLENEPKPNVISTYESVNSFFIVPKIKQDETCHWNGVKIPSGTIIPGDERYGNRYLCYKGYVFHHDQDPTWYQTFGKSWSVPVTSCQDVQGFFAYPNFVNEQNIVSGWNGGWIQGTSEGHVCGIGQRCHQNVCVNESSESKKMEEDTSLVYNPSTKLLHYFYDSSTTNWKLRHLISSDFGVTWSQDPSFEISGYDPSAAVVEKDGKSKVVLSYSTANCLNKEETSAVWMIKAKDSKELEFESPINLSRSQGNGICPHISFLEKSDVSKIPDSVLEGCKCDEQPWEIEACKNLDYKKRKCFAKSKNWDLRNVSLDIVRALDRPAVSEAHDDGILNSLGSDLLYMSLNVTNPCYPFEPRFIKQGSEFIQMPKYCSETGELPPPSPYLAPNRGIYSVHLNEDGSKAEHAFENNDSFKVFSNDVYFYLFDSYLTEGGVPSGILQNPNNEKNVSFAMLSRINKSYSKDGGNWRHSPLIVESFDGGNTFDWNHPQILPDAFGARSIYAFYNKGSLFAAVSRPHLDRYVGDVPLDVQIARQNLDLILYKRENLNWKKLGVIVPSVPVCSSKVNDGCMISSVYVQMDYLFYTSYDFKGNFQLRRVSINDFLNK